MTAERLKKYADWMDHKLLDETRPRQLVIKPHPGGVLVLRAVLFLSSLWIVIGVSRCLLYGEPGLWILLIPLGLGVLFWRRFRVVNTSIVLDQSSNRVSIPGAEPLRLSEIEKLYVVRWERQSAHRIRFNELNLETTDGRRENLLITPFETVFEEQAEKLSDWLGVPVSRW